MSFYSRERLINIATVITCSADCCSQSDKTCSTAVHCGMNTITAVCQLLPDPGAGSDCCPVEERALMMFDEMQD